jgi:hypothetical protein
MPVLNALAHTQLYQNEIRTETLGPISAMLLSTPKINHLNAFYRIITLTIAKHLFLVLRMVFLYILMASIRKLRGKFDFGFSAPKHCYSKAL